MHNATGVFNDFAVEAIQGLSQHPKTLPCKWFYDEHGSRLFERITQTSEYYLTRVETQLLEQIAPALAETVPGLVTVIEPGSGSSNKTRILLRALPGLKRYIPVDISADFLLQSAAQLEQDFPSLEIAPMVADFTASTVPLPLNIAECMVFFPGSTIGNFAPEEARRLLRHFHTLAGSNAWLLIGVDMTQHEPTLLAAYDDAAGITADFNQNILVRANRELGADFNIADFRHQAIFNRAEGRIEMHLVSTVAQQVRINGNVFTFESGETIHSENCYKYTQETFKSLASQCGWQLQQLWQYPETADFGIFLFKS